MIDDSKLKTLREEQHGLIVEQSELLRDLQSLQTQKSAEIERVERNFEHKITDAESKLEVLKRKLPDVTRQVERREDELRREAKKAA